MEWLTCRLLDLSPTSGSVKTWGLQAHCAAFHPTQALVAVALGRQILEFDVLLGSKLSSVDIGGTVMRMAYSPTGSHVIIAVLEEDMTIRSWDIDGEQTCIIYSPDGRKIEKPLNVHIALTSLKPWIFFAAHKRTTVNVVGTIPGVKAAQKLKLDVQKAVSFLSCHPRQPLVYVAYMDGSIRAYNLSAFLYQYALAPPEGMIKLGGAEAISYHSYADVMFVGDRAGLLIAYELRTHVCLGTISIQDSPPMSVAWHPTVRCVLVLRKDGIAEGYRAGMLGTGGSEDLTKLPGGPPGRGASFFDPVAMERLDVEQLLRQGGGGCISGLGRSQGPKPVELVIHSTLNAATVIFADLSSARAEAVSRGTGMGRDSRRMLLPVLQSTRRSSQGGGQVLMEKMSMIGVPPSFLSDHDIQIQMHARRESGLNGVTKGTLVDYARKSFLYGGDRDHQGEEGGGAGLLKLPIVAITDPAHPLRDLPVFQPFQREMSFFSTDSGSYIYPLRADFMDGCNLMGYSLATGEYNRYLQFAVRGLSGGERKPTHMTYSWKQHVWIVFFDCLDAPAECSLVRNPDAQFPGMDSPVTITGRDGAFLEPSDAQYAILDEEGMKLTVYTLDGAFEDVRPSAASRLETEKAGNLLAQTWEGGVSSASIRENGHGSAGIGVPPVSTPYSPFADPSASPEAADVAPGEMSKLDSQLNGAKDKVPLEFSFDSPVQRVFPCPLEDALLYVCAGSHVGIVSVRGVNWGGRRRGTTILSTSKEEHKSLMLQPLERVVQVCWQDTNNKGHVAGIVTTMRVLIVSASLQVIAETSTALDGGYPPFHTCLWVGPALLVSTATAIAVLGWDSCVRTVLTIDQANAGMLGMLNDRVLLASWAESPKTGGVEVKSRLLGLLEPLLIGWVTMQSCFDPQLDLSQVMFQITSRFDSLRITPRMLEVLSLGPEPCGDLSIELSYTQAGPQFTQELRCGYAIKARRFDTAFSILKDEFMRSRDYPRCPQSCRLFHRFRELGYACVRYGQFDKAKETFETVGDYESLFDLSVPHMNPSALRRIAQKLEESGTDPELKRQCDKLLALQSTGWGTLQGGAFSALMTTGDNMTPRGPEWAGGDWEIKVKPETKRVHDWQLSTEVSGHMKAAGPAGQSQAIPNIIADTLGVYLGTHKGRMQVLEVRDGSKFSSRFQEIGGGYENGFDAEREDNSHGSPGTDCAPSLFSQHGSGRVDEDASSLGVAGKLQPGGKLGRSGGPLLALPAPGEGGTEEETEEQKRAAKEFARGFKGSVSDSSSDDEDVLGSARRKSKFQIRIRDAKMGGTGKDAVDVDKLKEAMRQFKVGEVNTSTGMSMQFAAGGLKPGRLVFGSGAAGNQPGSAYHAPSGMMGTGENTAVQEWANRVSVQGAGASNMGFADGNIQHNAMGLGLPTPADGAGGHWTVVGDPGQSTHGGEMIMKGFGGTMGMGMPTLTHQESVFMTGAPGGGAVVDSGGGSGGLVDLSFDGVSGMSGVRMQPLTAPTMEVEGPIFGEVSGKGSRRDSSGPDSAGGGLLGFDTPPGSEGKLGGAGGTAFGGGVVFPGRGTEQGVSGSSPVGTMGGAGNQQGFPSGFEPKGASASQCFKAGLAHLERNALVDALACLNESFVALSKEFTGGKDVKSQARMCSQYKIAVLLLQEIAKLQKEVGVGVKEEVARMARHLSALPLQPKHRISCVRTAIKKNMDVHNYGYAKRMLDFLLAKAPPNKQAELKGMINICVQRGLVDRAIDGPEDSSKFCAGTLGRLPTIGHDTCDVCSANFSALSLSGCPICGLGMVRRSDALTGVYSSPFA